MSTVRRYFEVIGEAVDQCEALWSERITEIQRVQAVAEEHGFTHCAWYDHPRTGCELAGFSREDGEPDREYWIKVGNALSGEAVWKPKRSSKWGKKIFDQLDQIQPPSSKELCELFGLQNWEVQGAFQGGMTMTIAVATAQKFGDRFVVSVPEKDDAKAKIFEGHPCLRELTLGEWREVQRAAEEGSRAETSA